jgi:VIT1/CCC1 family predicted Fe2+/Mn2+ transporter
MPLKINQDYLRSFVFGCQDALVSTTGVVVGVSAAVTNRQYILASAIITLAVEALSMAAGQYLSEKSVHELPNNRHHDSLLLGVLVMFFSYLLGGFIPIYPILFAPASLLGVLSLSYALAGLFLLGYLKGKYFTGHTFRNSIEMLLIGGCTAIVALFIGKLFNLS